MIRKHTHTPGDRTLLAAVVATVSFVITSTAAAQERFWLDAAASAPVPLNGPYDSDYGQGFSGALGGYGSLMPQLSLGGRIGAGFLEEDDDVQPITDTLSFGTLSGALRLRPFASRGSRERSTGLWLEAAGGGAVLEDEVRPAIEPGLGYNFDTDVIGIGPFGRYTQIIETGDQFGGDDARLVMLGLEVTFLDGHDTKTITREVPMIDRGAEARLQMEREQMRQREAALQKEREALEAQREALERQREMQRVAGEEPESMVLDERLFFDYDKAELRDEGKQKLREIADQFKQNMNTWKIIRIQGNADRRGSDQYNLKLSGRRAMAARNYLVSLGVPEPSIKAEAYGEDWPRIAGAEKATEFQENRNVSFVIVLGEKGARSAANIKPPATQVEREQQKVPVSGTEEGKPMPTPGVEQEQKKQEQKK